LLGGRHRIFLYRFDDKSRINNCFTDKPCELWMGLADSEQSSTDINRHFKAFVGRYSSMGPIDPFAPSLGKSFLEQRFLVIEVVIDSGGRYLGASNKLLNRCLWSDVRENFLSGFY